ncbi:MAG: SAM-dependent methyltransferase [Candidatus Woesearchaeota archaeon]|nr:MAG: SAM-dependent methyltransferase [Candidatus Woesearchaeota archaeon]
MEHYFSEKPTSTPKKHRFKTRIRNHDIIIDSSSGIFSVKEIDFGTRLLIENAKINGKEVLDLGCGYGIIGIAIKKMNPDINITMIDINERAISATKKNCESNNVEATILKSDIFSNPQLRNKNFDTIITNPPFSAGKKVCFKFIEESSKHLNKGGLFELVAPHNKGGESLKKKMIEIFGNAGELVKKAGFRVYISLKK